MLVSCYNLNLHNQYLQKNWLILFNNAFPCESEKFVIEVGVNFIVSDDVKPNKSMILSLLSDWKLNSVFTQSYKNIHTCDVDVNGSILYNPLVGYKYDVKFWKCLMRFYHIYHFLTVNCMLNNYVQILNIYVLYVDAHNQYCL